MNSITTMNPAHVRHIQYVGRKQRKTDNITNSGLEWGQGEVLPVMAHIAVQLVNYPDVWKDVTGELNPDSAANGMGTGGALQALTQVPGDDIEKAVLRERVAVLEEENFQLKEENLRLKKQVLVATEKMGRQPRGSKQPVQTTVVETPPLVDLNAMDAAALQTHAQTELGMDLDMSQPPEVLRQRIAETIQTRESDTPITEDGDAGN
jgi:hypothetical protein